MLQRSQLPLKIAVTISIMIASIACALISYGPREVSGPDQKSDLLVYFKKDTTSQQILDFHHTVIGKPGRTPTETQFLAGMRSVMAIYSVQGYEGVAIDFWDTATQDEREAVKTQVLASPIVFKILEDAAPNEVKNLEQP